MPEKKLTPTEYANQEVCKLVKLVRLFSGTQPTPSDLWLLIFSSFLSLISHGGKSVIYVTPKFKIQMVTLPKLLAFSLFIIV